jgi:hypothetical protein
MLRHGRLKHKVNLKNVAAAPPPVEAMPTPSPSSDALQSLSGPVVDHVARPVDIDAFFSVIDPSLYAQWSVADFSDPAMCFIDPLPTLTIPNVQRILQEQGVREVLLTAVNSMSQSTKVPSLSSLYRYVGIAIDKFVPHGPFLPPNFNRETANPLLLIALASLGALHGAERKTALMLHHVCKTLEDNLRTASGYEGYPLWAIQTLYLNVVR